MTKKGDPQMKDFMNPEITVERFIAEDIITTSTGGALGGETPED